MCMEDVRIGRKTSANGKMVAIGAADTVIVEYNPARTALVLSWLAGGTINLALATDATLNDHLSLTTGTTFISLNVKDHGVMVHGPWHAIAGAAAFIGVIETLLADK